MDNKKLLIYSVLFIVGFALGFIIRPLTQSEESNALANRSNTEETQNGDTPSSFTSDTLTEETGVQPAMDTVTVTGNQPDSPTHVAEEETQSEPSTQSTASGTLPSETLCFTNDDEISLQLTLMAEQMERDSLWYNNREPAKLQDCSGIFHRISRYVKGKCENYKYPDPKVARDSRTLSGWFYDQENLKLVEDPVADRNLIRPGSVMFFGGTGKRFSNLTIEQLSAPYPNGIVEHIGVVTEVNKNDEGEVVGYVMMHGRRPGVFAQRSHYHNIDPPRLGYPPLGNWNQQWIAIGYIMTPM